MKFWEHARNILLVRLDAFGDVLMTEPAFRAVHQSLPHCRLTLLTSAAGARAATLIPYLNQTLIYEAPWMKHSREAADVTQHLDFIERLRAMQFDAAVIFTVYSQNPLPAAMLCYLAGIPRRLAFCRENPYQLLTDWLPEQEPNTLTRHEVARQLALVAAAGTTVVDDRMQIMLPPTARESAKSIWDNIAQPAECRIVVHPGATAASRRYPPDRFVAAMQLIKSRVPARFIVTGDTSEKVLAEEVATGTGGAISLAGNLDTQTWAAVIGHADLLLSSNTGAVHIAAATGTPVVVAYALTNPQHTPWRVPSRVLSYPVPCSYCYKSMCPQGHHQCLLGIRPGEVAAAVCELLESLPSQTAQRRLTARSDLERVAG